MTGPRPHAVPRASATAFRDIADDTTAEADRRALRRALHDMMSPVRVLKCLPDWIRDDMAEAGVALPDTVAQSLDSITGQALRMERMVRDFLGYELLKHAPLTPEVIDMGPRLEGIAGDVLGDLAGAFSVRGSPVTLTTDPDLFDTVFRELIGNALKHHPAPPGTITAELASGPPVSITISDDGPGIAPPHHVRVFDPFEALQSRDVIEGSGLGLATVRRAAGRLGAQLAIGIGLGGRGTAIRLTWPDRDRHAS